jgi:hypothetical protein
MWGEVRKPLASFTGVTVVLAAGATGSQLDATQDGTAGSCTQFTAPRVVYPDFSWLKNLQCFAHMLSVKYDNATGRCDSRGRGCFGD